jgi:hypothetical protein
MHNFGCNSERKENLEFLVVHGRMLLKSILKVLVGRMWTIISSIKACVSGIQKSRTPTLSFTQLLRLGCSYMQKNYMCT